MSANPNVCESEFVNTTRAGRKWKVKMRAQISCGGTSSRMVVTTKRTRGRRRKREDGEKPKKSGRLPTCVDRAMAQVLRWNG